MTYVKWIATACVWTSVAHATSASAALLAYEGFDYTTGSVATKTGGTGWTNAWGSASGGTANVTSPGASYAGLATPIGNQLTITPTSATTVASRTFASTAVNSGSIYFSVLIDKINAGTRFSGIQLLNGSTEQGFFGNNSDQASWSMSYQPSGINISSGVSHNSSNPTLLVLKVDFNFFSGQYERMSLYVNPTPGVAEPTPTVVSASGANIAFTGLTGIGVGAGYVSDSARSITTLDEIRIGTTWADVTPVPEPAGLAMLALGSAAVIRRRRPCR